MTSVKTATVPEPGVWQRFRWAIQDTVTMTWRDLIRTRRQPEMLSFAVIMGVFFLLLFYWVFGGAIAAGAGVDYIQYLVPGIFVITTLTGAQQTGTGLAADLAEGVTDRLRSLPMSQFAVLGGRTIADALRNIVGVLQRSGTYSGSGSHRSVGRSAPSPSLSGWATRSRG